jgi:hypothetical protein
MMLDSRYTMAETLGAAVGMVLNPEVAEAFKKLENIKVIGNIRGTRAFSSFCLGVVLLGPPMDFTLAKVRERVPEVRAIEIVVQCSAMGEQDDSQIIEALAYCWRVYVSRHRLAIDVLASVGINVAFFAAYNGFDLVGPGQGSG